MLVRYAPFGLRRHPSITKQEKIYLNPPNGGLQLYQNLKEYIKFYNQERRHTEIGKVRPDQIYYLKAMAP